MSSVIDHIVGNGGWICAGLSIALLGLGYFLRHLSNLLASREQPNAGRTGDQATRDHWQGVSPPGSRYETVSETRSSIPAGIQSFSFEYGPHGHAHPLLLSHRPVRLEIQFTCQISNPYLAMFAANEYALNVLPPKFLTEARVVLEKFSIKNLRDGRQKIAQDVMDRLSPRFEELGVRLESVTIGAIESVLSPSGRAGSNRASASTKGIKVVNDHSIHIGGNVINSQVGQTLTNCNNTIAQQPSGEEKDLLEQLQKDVKALLSLLPPDKRGKESEIADYLKTVVEQSTGKSAPNRRLYSVSAEGLLEASRWVKDFAGNIFGTVGQLGKILWPDFSSSEIS